MANKKLLGVLLLGVVFAGIVSAQSSSNGVMYANKYPLDDALKLFGAVSNYGAKAIPATLPPLGSGGNYYVDVRDGNNSNAGTKAAPWKELQYALDKTVKGDTIHIAEGNYLGPLQRGWFNILHSVALIGGYAHGFGNRNVIAYPTMIQPQGRGTGTKNLITLGDQASAAGTLQDEGIVVIDGIIFDRGAFNEYSATKGLVPGVEGGFLVQDPTFTNFMIGSRASTRVDLTIKNCVFLNSPRSVLMLDFAANNPPSPPNTTRKITIQNNVFVANCFSCVDISTSTPSSYKVQVEFLDNSVFFCWERTNESGTSHDNMGYGYRFRRDVNSNVRNCIFGFAIQGALDRAWTDSPTSNLKNRRTGISNNAFVLNRFADLQGVSSPNYFPVWVDQFEELDSSAGYPDIFGLTYPSAAVGNFEMTGDKLVGKLNKAYTKGFLDRTFGDPPKRGVPAPTNALLAKLAAFRAAFGL